MAVKMYRSAKQFAREHRVDLRRVLRAMAEEYTEAHFAEADRFSERINDRLRASGDLQESAARAEKALRKTKGWRDPGAAAIDYGRARNHYKGWSRMGGSAKAPWGITRPTREHALAFDQDAKRQAIAAAERRVAR